jgi:predicted alpha/beta-hydrolase family hydrolase
MGKYANGTNYAKTLDPSSANIIDPGLLGGKVRVMQDVATVTASTCLNSTDYIIVGGQLPTGSQVVNLIIGGNTVGGRTNATIFVGDEGDADRYCTAITVTAGGIRVGPTVATGMYYTVTGTTDNYIRLSGAATATIITSGTINVTIFYTVE